MRSFVSDCFLVVSLVSVALFRVGPRAHTEAGVNAVRAAPGRVLCMHAPSRDCLLRLSADRMQSIYQCVLQFFCAPRENRENTTENTKKLPAVLKGAVSDLRAPPLRLLDQRNTCEDDGDTCRGAANPQINRKHARHECCC